MWFAAVANWKVAITVVQTTAHAKKNDLSCISAGKGCHVVGCYNSSEIPDKYDVDDNFGLVDRDIFEII